MNKIKLVFVREYLSRVRKRSFLLTTFLVPLIIIGFYAAIIMISVDEPNEAHKVAVIDKGHLLDAKKLNTPTFISFQFFNEETEASLVRKYQTMGFQSFLYIEKEPSGSGKNKMILHSPSALSIPVMNTIEELVTKNVRNQSLEAKGVDPASIDQLTAGLTFQNTIDNSKGDNKGSAGVAYAVSYACGLLLYMMLIIYGTQVMRGVSEEKTNRISEVIVSSVRPFQLMLGKILGIGAVGLTQFIMWIGLIYGLQFLIPVIFPGTEATAGSKMSMFGMVLDAISALPLSKILFMFFFYFIFGYLTYAAIFAAVGSLVSDDQQEAQQMVFPIIMPIILGFVMMTKAVNEPNSTMAVFGSIFPLTSPVVMMGRMTYDIPYWHIALSMLALMGTFLFFTWMSGKIFRTGVLMYGKKPSWKEIMKWAFRKG